MKRRSSRRIRPVPEIDLRRTLAEAGWRLTRQREVVHGYLRSVTFHPTAEQVYAAVRREVPRISLATVYKALEALVEAGLATKLSDASGPARFDHRCDCHYHLRCLKSGQIRDLETPFDRDLLHKLDPQLVKRLRQQGFQVSGHHLEILGYFDRQPV
jgi:Fur family transcriptional regulator, peroxide stress response regulator